MITKRTLVGIVCAVLAMMASGIPAMAQNQDTIALTGELASSIEFAIDGDSCDFGSIDSSSSGSYTCGPKELLVTTNVGWNMLGCASATTALDVSHLGYSVDTGSPTDFTDCGTGATPAWDTIMASRPSTDGLTIVTNMTFQLQIVPADPPGDFSYTVNLLVEASS